MKQYKKEAQNEAWKIVSELGYYGPLIKEKLCEHGWKMFLVGALAGIAFTYFLAAGLTQSFVLV